MSEYAAYAQARRRPAKDREHQPQSSRTANNANGRLGVSTSGVEAKVVVMGNAGVGKTSLVQRYTTNSFNSTKTAATAGAAFHVKKTVINGVTVRLQLWDTAGQERFRSLAPMYYRGTHAAILVYDITNPSSFEDVKVWLEELKKNVPPENEHDMIVYIVGTKVDLAYHHRKVRPDRARYRLAQWFPLPRSATPPGVNLKPPNGSAMMQLAGNAFPSSEQQQSHFSIPSQLSSLSTSVSGHLPTLASFNLNIPQFDRIRPRFTSFTPTTATKPTVHFDNTGESPTGTDSTAVTAASSAAGSTSTAASSVTVPPPPAPSSGSRFAFPRSSTTSAVPTVSSVGMNGSVTGSGFSKGHNHANSAGNILASIPSSSSGVTRPKTTSMGSATGVEFPRAPPLTRRQTSAAAFGPNPSSGIRPSKSVGGPASGGRPRTLSRLSDDERERDRELKRERRPTAYRRFDEVSPSGGGPSRLRHAGDSSSGDDMVRRSALVRSRSRREIERSRDERRRLEERGCLSDPEGGPGLDEDSDEDVEEPQPWGLSQELKLCEVSAKDGQGVEQLFNDLLEMVIVRREAIEKERLARERDSVMLSVPTRVPTWGALGEEEEDDDDHAASPKSRQRGWGTWFGGWCGV